MESELVMLVSTRGRYAIRIMLELSSHSKDDRVSLEGNDGNDKVLKDFGTIARISKIEKVYPYVYLDSFYVPNCKNKEEKIKFLASYDNTVDYSKYTAKQLDKEIIVKAIQLQKKSL